MKFLKKNLLLIIVIILAISLCIFKQGLVRNLPILAYAGAVEDDELMVSHALNILNGNWLGNYTYNTLIKNIAFPILLAFSKFIGIAYINFVTLLYSIACIIFIFAISKKVKNKIYLLITFALLLFNPIMFSEEVIQRVYRNSVIPSLALLTIGAYTGMFLNRDDKVLKYASFSVIGAISLPCFYYTREDSMWMVPYIVFIIISTIIPLIIKFIKEKEYEKNKIFIIVGKILFLFLPVITTNLFGIYISNMNLKYYNTETICSSKNYSELTNAIYAVKPNVDIPYVTNPKEKLDRIAKVSPSFAKIKPELDEMMGFFESKDTGEVINGLFSWPLITAIYKAGYNTPEKEKEIISNITTELNEAMDKGLLERQNVMPILGCEALDLYGYRNWADAIIDAFIFIGDYDNIKIVDTTTSPYYPELNGYMSMFKEITGNRVVFEENSKDINGNLLIELQDQEKYIDSIQEELKVLKNIKNVYKYIANIIQILGIISYVFITIYVIINSFKKKYNLLNEWIISSGIIGAIFTLIVGVSYVEITQTKAIVYLYLAGSYPLFIAFSLISIYNFSKLVFLKIKDIKEKENEKNCNNRKWKLGSSIRDLFSQKWK